MVTSREIYSALSQLVPCVGCRRSVERLFSHVVESGSPALEPLTVKSSGMLSIMKSCLSDVKKLYTLFYVQDTHKPKPLGGSWMDVWELMSQECRNEVVVIDNACLLETLEEYLRKHRFCPDCKNKVLRAYNILIGDLDSSKEKGYCAALYEGLCCCPHEHHIHVYRETDFIAHLLSRAEPEFSGDYERRERHAKTIDIAQEEVLTCIGLFYLGIDTLRKSFEISVEKLEGISRLEQFFEELSEEERAKELKLEKKRQKKKNRRKNKLCGEIAEQEAENGKRVPDVGSVESMESYCHGCENHYEDENRQDRMSVNENISYRCMVNAKQDSSSHSNISDCGYSSSSEIGSREGSDVACSDGICNHEEPGDGSNIHSSAEDAVDFCSDCWPNKEERCKSKKTCSDLCNNERHNDICLPDEGVRQNQQLLHSSPTKETRSSSCALSTNTLHLPRNNNSLSVLLTKCGDSSDEENCLTEDEIQSFLKKHPTLYNERLQIRKRIKERFSDYCRAATRKQLNWKVVCHS
ncbi:hypothetical protein WMY93_007991 [Mugilogobius chulae]|uniref:Gametogenetin-binding protein 2 n=1 Tax=Mugilogobius chulae TaxID=88201 RepID=A0AAW0PET1_9GOBI